MKIIPGIFIKDKHMVPMISIVGYADAGKTTLIEKLIPELKKRGFRVGTVKHAVHESNLDTQGKDSWRHYAAGADTVVAASAEKIAMIKKKETLSDDSHAELSSLEPYFADMDVVFAEGYKNARKPKIEIFRASVYESPLFLNDDLLLAIVTDSDIQCRVPRFGLNDVEKLADLIEQKYLKKRG